jgi:uncharacterized OsmC-like protein
MTDRPNDASLATAVERTVSGLTRAPERARLLRTVTARLRDGVTCDIATSSHALVADFPEGAGGRNLGPTPSELLGGAIASCLVIGWALWAARLGVTLEALEITVETELDMRGLYGLGDSVLPGHSAVRCIANVRSPAPPERLRELAATVERMSPLLDDLRRSVPFTTDVRLGTSAAG